MKILTSVLMILPHMDAQMNVLTVSGRSGVNYIFKYDAKRTAHVREYTGFDDPMAVEKLQQDDADMTDALMAPGWVIRREYVFTESAAAVLDQSVELIRRLNLRLMFNCDAQAARDSFTEEDRTLLEEPLAGEVDEFLRSRGVATPNGDWGAIHAANLSKAAGLEPVEPAKTAVAKSTARHARKKNSRAKARAKKQEPATAGV